MGTPLELAVRALKHVVGAKPFVVLEGKVKVGERIGLGLFQKLVCIEERAVTFWRVSELSGTPRALLVKGSSYGFCPMCALGVSALF